MTKDSDDERTTQITDREPQASNLEFRLPPQRILTSAATSLAASASFAQSAAFSSRPIVQKGFENNHIVDGRPPLTHGRIYTEDEMWNNLEYWINIITITSN